ncbi:MAG: Baseplate J-like protein [Methanosaeta sp. PtaU1.Bin060]|nr:MAG: Baseplate J-like protein [Methanosaeta sp. PtaU1.Bin060]
MTAPTVATLVKRLEDAQAEMLPGQVSGDQLTMHYLANLTVASQLRDCYLQMETGLEDIDVLKATDSKLDAIVSHVLIEGRLLGDFATGTLSFRTDYEASEDILIPAGTRVYAILEDGTKIYFKTSVAGVIAEGEMQADIAAQAEARGVSGNLGPYGIVDMVSRITGITSVENPLEFTGGTPDETDAELRTRYFDAIQAPGKATILMLERALAALSTVPEARIVSYGYGDIGVLVDHSEGIAETSQEIVDCIRTNMACGIHARGCLGATTNGSSSQVLTDDVYGGLIWARPREFVASEDTFSLTYLDMNGLTKTANITIPAATHRGVMVAAIMDSEDSRAKKILAVTPSGHYSYDILVGMGEPGYLYNLPELVTIDILATIRLTDTPEAGLIERIEASLQTFLGAFLIGERLEYSDVLRFFQNLYDHSADEYIGRALKGIDEIVSLQAIGGGQTASAIGERILVEEDWRIEAGDITITVQS